MYFISDSLMDYARQCFRRLEEPSPEEANAFFELFGPGNVLQFEHRPYERFSDYESLLRVLESDDPEKYDQIHKGTPFYYMAWLAFDSRNFEKGLFYMDAAISEDIRQSPSEWMNRPAASFIVLRQPGIQVARRTIEQVEQALREQIDRFNSISSLDPLSIEDFIQEFVMELVQDVVNRNIVTALYVYLLEFNERFGELRLRSTGGGSISPVLLHLFKGGVIFESLLKHLYPLRDDGQRTRTLGDVFHTPAFRSDFPFEVHTSADSLQDVVNEISNSSIQTSFVITTKLRNTTGHSVVWQDVFENPEVYRNLYWQETNALLYLIQAKFC